MSFYPKLVCVGSLYQKEFSNSGMLGWLVGTVKNSGIFSRLFNHLELEMDTVVGAPWNWLKLLNHGFYFIPDSYCILFSPAHHRSIVKDKEYPSAVNISLQSCFQHQQTFKEFLDPREKG